jgi:hypothetical protein
MAHQLYSLAYGFPFVLVVLVAAFVGAKLVKPLFRGSLFGSAAVVTVMLFGKSMQHYNLVDGGDASYAHTTQALFFSCIGVALGFGLLSVFRDQFTEVWEKDGAWATLIAMFGGILASTLVATGFTLWMIGSVVLRDEIFNSLLLWMLVAIGVAFLRSETVKPAK